MYSLRLGALIPNKHRKIDKFAIVSPLFYLSYERVIFLKLKKLEHIFENSKPVLLISCWRLVQIVFLRFLKKLCQIVFLPESFAKFVSLIVLEKMRPLLGGIFIKIGNFLGIAFQSLSLSLSL